MPFFSRGKSFEIFIVPVCATTEIFPARCPPLPISQPRAFHAIQSAESGGGGRGGTRAIRVGQCSHENSKSNLAGEGWRSEAGETRHAGNRRGDERWIFQKEWRFTGTRNVRAARVRFTRVTDRLSLLLKDDLLLPPGEGWIWNRIYSARFWHINRTIAATADPIVASRACYRISISPRGTFLASEGERPNSLDSVLRDTSLFSYYFTRATNIVQRAYIENQLWFSSSSLDCSNDKLWYCKVLDKSTILIFEQYIEIVIFIDHEITVWLEKLDCVAKNNAERLILTKLWNIRQIDDPNFRTVYKNCNFYRSWNHGLIWEARLRC